MASIGSVSRWISEVRSGSDSATTAIWDRFRPRLMAVARSKLQGADKSVADEEDAALGAYFSFLRRTAEGGFAEIEDRDDLWRLLVTMTARKVTYQLRGQRARKRGGEINTNAPVSLAHLEAATPSPELIATMNDSVSHLMSLLGDAELKRIVVLKMEGYTNEEIAEKIDRSLPTVERRLRLIRDKWQWEVEL